MSKTDLRNYKTDEIKSWLKDKGEKPFRTQQIMHWLWKQPVQDFDSMKNVSKELRAKLKSDFTLSSLKIKTSQKGSDSTIKCGFELFDKKLIEGVLIPSGDRVTACISTQVGCRMGCKFCATAQLGFTRSLSSGEIYLQVYMLNQMAEESYGRKISNVVIMGMGEPFDNYSAVKLAVEYMCSENGMGMSHRRITLSTVGVAPMIRKMADDQMKIHLSISLHAANDKLRSSIMPANNKYSLKVLSEALQYYHSKTKARVSYEYLLLGGVNDKESHAKELAEFAKISPCKVNLIEYNPVKGLNFTKSAEEDTQRFIRFLEKRNMVVNLRRSRGADVDAACGQLANKFKEKFKM